MNKRTRPHTTHGPTERIDTGCGHMYITIGNDADGPIEVFARLGKAGGCAISQLEAITRCISIGLKFGVPIEEYIEQLTGIRCPEQMIVETCGLSCADAIAKGIKLGVHKTTGTNVEEK